MTRTGAVHVLYGAHSGLSDAGNQVWSEESLGGSHGEYAKFGYALVALPRSQFRIFLPLVTRGL